MAQGFALSPDGVRIAWKAHGAGEPTLVLIHGWSCDQRYWAAQIGPLSRHFRIVTLDLAGHGESGDGREAWTIESFGRDVAAVVEAAGLGPAVLVGHSMGGTVAVAAARHLRERVRALVWVDSYRRLGSPRTAEEVQSVLAPFRSHFQETTRAYVSGMFPAGADEALVRRVVEPMSKAPPRIAVAALESSLTFGRTITQALEELEAPVFAINSGLPPSDPESLRRFGVEVIVMPGLGHFLMMEDPARFNDILRGVASRATP